MPLWGTARYQEQKYGWDGLPTALETRRRVWSANHPWLGALGLSVGYRAAHWELWTVNPTTLADVTRLPGLGTGLRDASWEDTPRQTETLRFTVLKPSDYLPGGTYASLVARGTLLRLYWLVRSSYGSVQDGTGLYRVTKAPTLTVTDGQGSNPPAVECEDWLQQPLRDLMLEGANPLGNAVAIKDAMLALGCPAVWSTDSYATLAAALVYYAAGHRLRVPEPWRTANWWGSSSPAPPPGELPAPPPSAPPPTIGPPTAVVGVGPNTTNRSTLTHFDISWTYGGDDPTGGDAIFIGPNGLSEAQASTAAASLAPGDPRLLSTGGFLSQEVGTDIALDFGAGVAARFWYWHRAHGALATAGLVALLG